MRLDEQEIYWRECLQKIKEKGVGLGRESNVGLTRVTGKREGRIGWKESQTIKQSRENITQASIKLLS